MTGPACLQTISELSAAIGKIDKRPVIITSNDLLDTIATPLAKNLSDVPIISFEGGETNKTRKSKELIEDQLIAKGFTKDTLIIALGGGVTTDLAGFVAATYCRGVSLIMAPTTLMGMVDASIGGKVGVNAGHYKNMIGTIYPAEYLFVDPSFLKTLPDREFKNGIVEMIKHGLIAGRAHFEFLEQNATSLLKRDHMSLQKAISDSIAIKKSIVELDPYEKGMRRILNFGHTIGHAIESISNYAVSHGQAVACGLVIESYISLLLNMLDRESFERIRNILKVYDIKTALPKEFTLEKLKTAITYDKKSIHGRARFALLDSIGHAAIFEGSYCKEVDPELINQAIAANFHEIAV
jgi:3-dehydroquinate synthase